MDLGTVLNSFRAESPDMRAFTESATSSPTEVECIFGYVSNLMYYPVFPPDRVILDIQRILDGLTLYIWLYLVAKSLGFASRVTNILAGIGSSALTQLTSSANVCFITLL